MSLYNSVSPVGAGPVRDEKGGRYTVIARSRAARPPEHVKGTLEVRWPNRQVTEGANGLSERAPNHVLLPFGLATVQMAKTAEEG